jgi:hypothetical protein
MNGYDIFDIRRPERGIGHPRYPLNKDSVLRSYNPDFDLVQGQSHDLIKGMAETKPVYRRGSQNVGHLAFQDMLRRYGRQ